MRFDPRALLVITGVTCLAVGAAASPAVGEDGTIPQPPRDCAFTLVEYADEINQALGCLASKIPPSPVSGPVEDPDPFDVEVGTPDYVVPTEFPDLVFEAQDLIEPVIEAVPDLGDKGSPVDGAAPRSSNTYTCYYSRFGVFGGSYRGAPSQITKGDSGRFFAGQDLRNTNYYPVSDTETAKLHVYHGVGLRMGDAFTRVQVTGNYSYKGNVHIDPGFGPTGYGSGSADFNFYSKLLMRAVGSDQLVGNTHSLSSKSFASPIPGNKQTIADSGSESHDVTLIGGRKDVFFVTDMAANISTDTTGFSNSETDFQFGPSDGLYLNAGSSQKWVFTLKKGYRLASCS